MIDAFADLQRGGDQAAQDIGDIWSMPWKGKSALGNLDDLLGRTYATGVPLIAGAVSRGGAGVIGALDSLFTGDLPNVNSSKAREMIGKPLQKESNLSQGPLGLLGTEGQPQGIAPASEDLISGLEAGDYAGAAASPLDAAMNTKDDELNNRLRDLIMSKIGDYEKNNQEKDTDPLTSIFGNYNKGLFKMGMGILANSGYPNSAGEAIGKGILGAQESEEKSMLAKNERNNDRLKQLLNLRYMNSMIESMDPQVKMKLAQYKAQQDNYNEVLKLQGQLQRAQASGDRTTANIIMKAIMEKQNGAFGPQPISGQENEFLRGMGVPEAEQPEDSGISRLLHLCNGMAFRGVVLPEGILE